MEMNEDGYGYVINGPLTYARIAKQVAGGYSVALLWTDCLGTQLSALFVIPEVALPKGDTGWCGLHIAIQPTEALVVAVRGWGMMAIPLGQDDMAPLHPDYVAEKLRMAGRADETVKRFTDLINGVLTNIRAQLP